MQIVVNWLIYTFAIIIAGFLLPGVHISNFTTASIIAVILGILNLLIRPILVLLTLPVNILTLGLFVFVINALLIMITSSVVGGFKVDGFGWALLFAIVLAVVTPILTELFDMT